MTFRPRPDHPYAHAARIPDDASVDVETLVLGAGPIEIEVGPGRGGFVYERLEARADVRLIAFEIRLKWAALVDDRLRLRGLAGRARVFNGDAREVLPRLAPDASIATFFFHFPDPWWKKRHEKRLVMSPDALDHVARLLRDGGELFVQTDVEDRALEYEAQIGEHALLAAAGDAEGSARLAANPYGARSPREIRAIEDGLPITRLRYRRKPRDRS